jgi:hypothetical protein
MEGGFYKFPMKNILRTAKFLTTWGFSQRYRPGLYLVKWLGYPESFSSLNRTYKSTQHLLEVSVLRMAPSDMDSVSSWVTCGKKTPRSEVVFLSHLLILYTVIVKVNLQPGFFILDVIPTVRILYLCQSNFPCSMQIHYFRQFRRVMSQRIVRKVIHAQSSILWAALLSSCLGYLLPSPTIKSKHVLSDSA